MDNRLGQLDAAALADELELVSDLELELSDFDSDFFSVEPDDDELEDSELFVDEPLDELLDASRLSVR